MKIIFLDIDGVLNHAWSNGNCNDRWESYLIARLNIITDMTQAKIVLSSTWRKGYSSMQALWDAFTKMGIKGDVIDRTPWGLHKKRNLKGANTMIPRGEEIQAWLDENNNLNIEKFIILDDESDMLHLSEHLIQTNYFDGGLHDCHMWECIRRLT